MAFTKAIFSEAASKKRTVAAKFRDDMQKLVATLNASEGHFIRCIKTNPHQAALDFDAAFVLEQLRCSGLVQVTHGSYITK